MSKSLWSIDPMHSEIMFRIKHMLITNVSGTFDMFQSTIEAEKKDFSDMEISFSADVASINTRNDHRDEHLRSNDFFDAALCYDLSARAFHYFYFDFTTEEAAQEHLVLEERLCARYDIPLSSKQTRKGVNVSEADSGIWLCLAMHLCIEGYDVPAWVPSMRLEARIHIAACLLQRRCPPSRDLIIMSTPTCVSSADLVDRTLFAPVIYYPTEVELWGDFPTYNMLHPGYVYHPCTNHELQWTIPRGLDISIHSLTDMDTSFRGDTDGNPPQ